MMGGIIASVLGGMGGAARDIGMMKLRENAITERDEANYLRNRNLATLRDELEGARSQTDWEREHAPGQYTDEGRTTHGFYQRKPTGERTFTQDVAKSSASSKATAPKTITQVIGQDEFGNDIKRDMQWHETSQSWIPLQVTLPEVEVDPDDELLQRLKANNPDASDEQLRAAIAKKRAGPKKPTKTGAPEKQSMGLISSVQASPSEKEKEPPAKPAVSRQRRPQGAVDSKQFLKSKPGKAGSPVTSKRKEAESASVRLSEKQPEEIRAWINAYRDVLSPTEIAAATALVGKSEIFNTPPTPKGTRKSRREPQ